VWVRRWPDAPPRDVSVGADEHDATAFDSIQVVPSSSLDHVADEGDSRGARNIGGGVECSFARRIGERDERVAEKVEGRALLVEPEMRGSMTRPSDRKVLTDRVSGARRGGAIAGDDRRFVDVSQHESVDRIRRSRGAEARIGARDRMRAALWLITLEQRGTGPTREHTGELPRQVVGVGDAAIHAEPAHRCGDMRSIAGEEDAVDPVTVSDERGGFSDPVAQVAHLDTVVTEATADELEAAPLGQRSSGLVRVIGNRQEPSALVVDRGK
jgi:hypothetical protein